MRLIPKTLILFLLSAITAAAQGGATPVRLVAAEVAPSPWNVQSGGIAAYDVTVDENGAVAAADIVQDVPPYGSELGAALPRWRFEPARSEGRAVRSRVLVLGFFSPPALIVMKPENPRYKSTVAPDEIPWPTSVKVPPYPPNVIGSGKVILEVDISDRGQVTSARVVSAPSAFDDASVQTAQQWVFRPALSRRGREAASRAYFIFSFVGTTPLR